MKLANLIGAVVIAGVATGCGALAPTFGSGGSPYSGGFGFGCLGVQNDAAGGGGALTAVRFLDPVTLEEVRTEVVLLLPGEEIDLMDVPAGDWLVVGVYADGFEDPAWPYPGYAVTVIPEDIADAQGLSEAAVTFRHP